MTNMLNPLFLLGINISDIINVGIKQHFKSSTDLCEIHRLIIHFWLLDEQSSQCNLQPKERSSQDNVHTAPLLKCQFPLPPLHVWKYLKGIAFLPVESAVL